jgi:ribosomal protein L37E
MVSANWMTRVLFLQIGNAVREQGDEVRRASNPNWFEPWRIFWMRRLEVIRCRRCDGSLAKELQRQGFQISSTTIGQLLRTRGYSLQANRKTIEGKQHPDRNAQFEHIAARVKAFQRSGQPAISVDTKKKENLGNMKNPGKTYRPKGRPRKVKTHDFPDKEKGKAVPYGVYDITHNEAGVSVGISHDTAEFAVAAIRRWWQRMGQRRYPEAKRLLITADCGGSNSPRTRLWRWALQQLANKTGLRMGAFRKWGYFQEG